MPVLGASSLSDECERTGVDEVVATWAGDANDAAMQSATSVHNARRDGCCDGSWLNIVAVAGADTNAGIRRACEHRSGCAFCGTCGATSGPAQGVTEARGGRGHQLPGLQYGFTTATTICDNGRAAARSRREEPCEPDETTTRRHRVLAAMADGISASPHAARVNRLDGIGAAAAPLSSQRVSHENCQVNALAVVAPAALATAVYDAALATSLAASLAAALASAALLA